MVLTRSLETASTGQFLTILYFGFFGAEPEPAKPELAELGTVTEPLQPEPAWLETEPNRTVGFLTFVFSDQRATSTSTLARARPRSCPKQKAVRASKTYKMNWH